MGERNKSTEAIILSVKVSGENNRSVLLLSPEAGLFYATLYGGPKSRLRSLVQNFNTGKIWYYEDETKHSRKITDFEGKSFRLSFSSDIYKMMAANLAGELVIKTKAAGEPGKAFYLLNGFLDGMDRSSEEESRLGLLRFLWRYVSLSGLETELSFCADCGKNLFSEEGDCAFIEKYGSFVCPSCFSLHSRENGISRNYFLDRHALIYLSATTTLPPSKVRLMALPAPSAYKMKQFVYHAACDLLDVRLNTLDAAKGIL
ncbi:MAG: DNA repair protein RecO C-terminal domain-containing protein [Treponema sp.]|nr:DNA repair protein RecO C-terminal domain-containing protein [Treponema sp.]